MPRQRLFSLEFIILCSLTFLAMCNVAVFYNLHLYLGEIGFRGISAGLIIGLYSMAAMGLYLFASQHIRPTNAFACIGMGMLTVAVCGGTYPLAHSFAALAVLRIANGVGMFLVMASAMVLLVTIIPPDQTGMAFSLYSVALLLPYAIMPAVSEVILPWVGSPPMIYLASTGLLLPALACLPILRKRIHRPTAHRRAPTAHRAARRLMHKPVLAILLVNTIYFTIFAALFFLFEGLGHQRGLTNPGFFFSVQMGVMILIRLGGGRLFDAFSKVRLVAVALLVTGAGFALLIGLEDAAWIFPIAVVFGAGMGLCVPPLNALMYLVTHPPYRGYNANMMMLTVHVGNFMGPFVGAWIIDVGGYQLFLKAAVCLSVGAAVFFVLADPGKHIISG